MLDNNKNNFSKQVPKYLEPALGITAQDVDGELKFNPKDYFKKEKELKSTWTDWLPLTSQLINSLISASHQKNLKSKLKYPLSQGTNIQYKTTDDYAQAANQLNNIAKMKEDAEQQMLGVSDLRTGLKYKQDLALKANELNNNINSARAEAFNKSQLQALEISNKNKAIENEIANKNAQVNAAAANLLLNAEAEYDLSKLLNLNSYIGNMAQSFNKYRLDENINKFYKIRNDKLLALNEKLYDLYNQDILKDYKKSKAWEEFRNSQFAGDVGDYEDSDQWYIDQWNNGSELAKPFIDKYNQEINQVNSQAQEEHRRLYNDYIRETSKYNLPTISNQHYNFFKSGGKVHDRFIDFAKHHRGIQKSVDEINYKNNKLLNDTIENRLKRISLEELILLKNVFK